MRPRNISDYLEAAIKAAQRAGSIHKRWFHGDFKIEEKSSSFDLLTAVDRLAEKAVVSLIRKRFPDHNILAEEDIYKKTPSEYTWIIDPLDGTNNFVSGLPIFSASVALAYRDEVIAGAIYDVSHDELFYAQKNKGAYLNGKPIRVSPVNKLKKSILITGFYYDRGREMIRTLGTIKRFLIKHILGLRRLGAASLDLCYVASGRVAGFWEFELSPWDFAAGKLLVEEAGGVFSGRRGERISLMNKSFVVASNGRIHKQMLSVINWTK